MSDSKGGAGGMGMNMVTTVMAFSVSAFFVLFVFTRLLCARLHLSRARAAAAAAGDAVVVQGYNVRRSPDPPCYLSILPCSLIAQGFWMKANGNQNRFCVAVQVERGIHALEPSVVTTFPTVKLGDGGGQQPPPVQEESQCTVCLEGYEAKDVVRVLPACGHAFHAACIDAWLRQHPTCPVCRASLRAKNGTRATPLDYSLLVAGAAARGPVAAAAAAAQQVPASSSDLGTSPQAVGHQHHTDDMGADGLLEIISEEPATSGDPSPAAADHSHCADAARQSEGSAGASEHC
ncbi:putative RING-H2 finger protein ATL37 isoform X1 [Miscanthus floridulus]|uniref:putative RING-H2 finger protein ATL37 isoform X1 n=1 Tax=Miscanthus floridulus TaxID=154761 RepID=UPI00345A1795